MDDFLGMLRRAADKVLGTGHSYGTASDEVVTNKDPQKEFLNQQAHAPADPNVQYSHPTQPQLQRMPAREPVQPKAAKPAERIQQAIDAIRRQNQAINEEVAREYRQKTGLTVDGTPEPEMVEGQDGGMTYVRGYKPGGLDI